jgi:hypothetical protein
MENSPKFRVGDYVYCGWNEAIGVICKIEKLFYPLDGREHTVYGICGLGGRIFESKESVLSLVKPKINDITDYRRISRMVVTSMTDPGEAIQHPMCENEVCGFIIFPEVRIKPDEETKFKEAENGTF